jgi:hypothetical protein
MLPPLLMPLPEPAAPPPAPPAPPPPPACASAIDVYDASASDKVAPRITFESCFIATYLTSGSGFVVCKRRSLLGDVAVAMARLGRAAVRVTAMAFGRAFIAGVALALVRAKLLSRFHFTRAFVMSAFHGRHLQQALEGLQVFCHV